MTIWHDFGFRANPYSTEAIPPTSEGVEMLVGREKEAARLHRLITSSDTHPTIEGDNGVGKTSLVQVTSYTAMRGAASSNTNQVHLPLPHVFQIVGDQGPDDFIREVCFGIVDGFQEHHDLLRELNLDVPDVSALDRWVNQPFHRSGSVITPVGGGGVATVPSTTDGFSQEGLVRTVFGWLEQCFPTRGVGGFVCVLDNLELLESSSEARRFLEALRDSLFMRPGLEWVLCGARGVVRGAANSPRLGGVLGSPLELGAVDPKLAGEVITRRVELFSMDHDPFLPVGPDGFAYIYQRVNNNLRESLKLSEAFALQFNRRPTQQPHRSALFDLLVAWLNDEGSKYRAAAREVPADAWSLFEAIVEQQGVCSTSQARDFGLSSDGFRGQVGKLAQANLVYVEAEDFKEHHQTVTITSSGWLVHWSSQLSGTDD